MGAPLQTYGKSFKRTIIKIYMLISLGSLMLLPTAAMPGLIPSLRLDDLLLIGFPIIALMTHRECHLDLRVWILTLVGVAIFLGFLTGALKGFPSSAGDLFFVIRVLKYIGAVLLAIGFVMIFGKERSPFIFIKASLIFGLLAALIGIQQFFDLGGLNSKYVHFVAPTKFDTLIGGYRWPRPVGMAGNPNVFGYQLVLIGLAGLYLWASSSRLAIAWKIISVVILAASVLTMSRSSIFAGLLAIAVFAAGLAWSSFSFTRLSISREKAGIFLWILMGVVALTLVFLINETVFNQLTWRFMPEHFGSFAAREKAWAANYEAWGESVLFGIGPLRHGGVFSAADNEHFLLLRTGGILLYGLFIMLLVMGLFARGLNLNNRFFQLGVVLSVIAYMVPAAAFYSLVIFPWLLMLLVILAPMPIGRLKV